jgi:hypothetical protein
MRTFSFVACLFVATTSASAQGISYRIEGEATWWWEASADGGATWTPSFLEVPAGQGVVKVRASCAFPPGPRHYFAGAMIDQTITGLNHAGLNDTVVVTDQGFTNPQTLNSLRFGNVLKIDDESDTLPPGEGPSNWGIFQPGHAVGPWTYANPVLGLMDFDLYLDGTAGDRLIDAWWRDWSAYFPNDPIIANMGPAILMLNRNLVDWDYIYPDLTVNPLTIRVIPAPGAVALLLAPWFGVTLRRHRD